MLLIAEAGPCNNSVEYATAAATAAAEYGFGAFKVQMYQPHRITTPTAPTYALDLDVPDTQTEAFAGALPYEAWTEVKEHCDRLGIEFLASVFDGDAVDAAVAMGCRSIKVASGEITNRDLLRRVGETGLHVYLSTGASTVLEVERAFGWVTEFPRQVTVMACTLAYPCPLYEAGVGRVEYWRSRGFTAGYSDHTRGWEAVAAAEEAGAVAVEKHWTITPDAGGDHGFAAHPGTRRVSRWPDTLYGDPMPYPRPIEYRARQGARRSLVAAVDMEPGDMFERFDALRPGVGLEPWMDGWLLGRRARRAYRAGDLIDPGELTDRVLIRL